MATASSSSVENPLNPLGLPQIMTIGSSLLIIENVMQFNDSLLKFCYDKMVDFESLKENNFYVEELFFNQGWKRYFEMLNGPIFTNLVKEFWMKSKVYDDLAARIEEEHIVLKDPSLNGKTRKEMGLKEYNGTEIRSNVAGLDVTITKAHFAKLLSLEDRGKKISEYKIEIYYREAINKELYDDDSLAGKSRAMKDQCVVLFKIFISSIMPRSGGNKKDIGVDVPREMVPPAPIVDLYKPRKRKSSTKKEEKKERSEPKVVKKYVSKKRKAEGVVIGETESRTKRKHEKKAKKIVLKLTQMMEEPLLRN
ncbi:hypothetical protein A2U01_0005593 [Trifolium medium]|uniref:Cullin-like protein n=1 Tax=Trifolium medium TaxID=97028 RepID=A0A392MB71_9FABA|nr:hypothetical protein [Trifolium medium]